MHRLGHGLKGAMKNYGFRQLGDLFYNIELSARNHDSQGVEKSVWEIRQYINRMEIVYDRPTR